MPTGRVQVGEGDAKVDTAIGTRARPAERRATDTSKRALLAQPLEVVGQPIIALADGRVVGFESLARFPKMPEWSCDGVFSLAMKQGVGPELEEKAVRLALTHLDQIHRRNAFLTVNLSPTAAANGAMKAIAEASAVDDVILEITEQSQVGSYVALNRTLLQARVRGLRVAIDDIGAGFANWGHLVHLQPDMIKIDGQWTSEVDSDPVRRAMVRALIAFAREIDAVIVAEQVETAGQLAAMRELGVDYVQGYFLCRPEPFETLLARTPVR